MDPEILPLIDGEFTNNEDIYIAKDHLFKGDFNSKIFLGMHKNHQVHIRKIPGIYFDKALVSEDVNRIRSLQVHNNLTVYFHILLRNHELVLVSEFMETSLQFYVKQDVRPMKAIQILQQASIGLEYLHSLRIVHGYLKPATVLVNPHRNTVKLSEFGMSNVYSKLLKGYLKSDKHGELLDYTAPEILASYQEGCFEAVPTFQSDIFSIGCVFYYALSLGKHPFGKLVDRAYNMLNNIPSLNNDNIESSDLNTFSVLSLLLSKEQSARPSAALLNSHPIFWSAKQTANFFRNILDLSTSNVAREITMLSGMFETQVSSFWNSSESNSLKELLKVKKQAWDNTLRCLLETLTILLDTESKVSLEYFKACEETPEQYTTNIFSQVPFLVEVLWLVMQHHSGRDAFEIFYRSGCTQVSSILQKEYPGLTMKPITHAKEFSWEVPALETYSSFSVSRTKTSDDDADVDGTKSLRSTFSTGDSRKTWQHEQTQASVLTEIEEPKLTHRSMLPMNQVKDLYENLVTRDTSSYILKDDLVETLETGALEILKDGLLTETMQRLEISPNRQEELNKNINSKDSLGDTLVHMAAERHKIEQLKHFKLYNGDLEARNAKGETPLLKIVHSEQDFTKILTWFINQKVNLNATDNNGNNLVFLAIQFRSKLHIETLINLGINWNVTNNNGDTVLHLAAQYGNVEILEYFKSLGADVNAKNKAGETPFLKVAYATDSIIEKLFWFVKEKVDVHGVDCRGNNLALLSTLKGQSKVQLQIISFGIDWRKKNYENQGILHLAARGGNIQALEYFTQLGADINERDNFGYTPLLHVSVCQENFTESLQWLLNHGSDPDVVCSEGNTLAHLATLFRRSTAQLEQIIDFGIDWKKKNNAGQGILHMSAQGGNVEALKYFTELGADINERDNSGCTPLLNVSICTQNFTETLHWLLYHGSDPRDICSEGNNLAILAALVGRSTAQLKQIIDFGIDWRKKNKKGEGVLHMASQGGNIEALEYFTDLGADIDEKDSFGNTPLLHVSICTQNFTETLHWLLNHGSDPDVVCSEGSSLAHFAAINRRSRAQLEQIVDLGIDWRKKDNEGRGVLHLAANGGNVEALEYFTELGADINERDNFGYTPLLHVSMCQHNFTETLRWLLHHGSDPKDFCSEGNGLAHLAALHGRSRAQLKQIIDFGIDWKIRNINGNGVLHMASQGGNIEALEYFTELGADINERDNFGYETIIQYAGYKNPDAVVLMLKRLGADCEEAEPDLCLEDF